MNHYTYYSYEPYGRGYIGSRQCPCPPEKDPYMGSFSCQNFSPSEKIILSTYQTRTEALEAEVLLHDYYKVDVNPHFANRARQTSSFFIYHPPKLGKVWATDGTNESVMYEDEIPAGWWRGRCETSTTKSTNNLPHWGKMYSTFCEDCQADRSILEISNRVLAKRYRTSHTSIKRWKDSLSFGD